MIFDPLSGPAQLHRAGPGPGPSQGPGVLPLKKHPVEEHGVTGISTRPRAPGNDGTSTAQCPATLVPWHCPSSRCSAAQWRASGGSRGWGAPLGGGHPVPRGGDGVVRLGQRRAGDPHPRRAAVRGGGQRGGGRGQPPADLPQEPPVLLRRGERLRRGGGARGGPVSVGTHQCPPEPRRIGSRSSSLLERSA